MPIQTDGPLMEPDNKGIDEFHVGYGATMRASAAQAWEDSPINQLIGINEMDRASGKPQPDFGEIASGIPTPSNGPAIAEDTQPAAANIDIIDANDRVKKAGLAPHLKLPDQPDIPPAQLAIMMDRAKRRADLDATIERGPGGFIQSALDTGTSFAVGAVDPLNVASAFIPVVGELRYGKILASAGDSLLTRTAVRASTGAAEGVVGQAALEPLDWYSHTQDGRDFGMADVLQNLMFGAALGGGLHAGGGFISDAYRGAKGRAVYPFGPGEPMENVGGTHVPAGLLHEDGVDAAALHDHFSDSQLASDTSHPEIISRLQDLEARSGALNEAAQEAIERAGSKTDPSVVAAFDAIDAHQAEIKKAEQDLAQAAGWEPPQLSAPPSPAVQIINDLPQRAHEDAMRGAIASLIDGEPVRAGEMLEAASKTDPRIQESFDLFHGSPHGFDAFDNSKIGTGEGAQAFAYGHYFAENEAVAARYSEAVPGPRKRAEIALDLANGDRNRAIADLRDMGQHDESARIAAEELAAGKSVNELPGTPTVYRVRIKPERERFLQWETDLTEQPAGRLILEKMDPTLKEQLEEDLARHDQPELDQLTGGMLHRLLERYASEGELPGVKGEGGHPKREASEYLASLDVPGVEFLDQKSRKRGALGDLDAKPIDDAATRNFVVFNDKDIEITHKNGEPVKREEIPHPQRQQAKPLRGRAAADPQTWSLYEFLAHEGGLKPDQELQAIFGNHKGPFVPGFGALVRPGGRTLDDALRLAKDHGYLFDAADVTGAEGHVAIRDLLDKVAEENSGRKQYRDDQQHTTKAADAAALERETHEIVSALHDEIEATSGVKGSKIDPRLENRVVEIITREGEHDVLAAYERAIMEDEERYNAETGHQAEPGQTVAGRHLPDDAGAAPDRSGAIADAGAAAGRAGPGAGADAGRQPRSGGAGDRAAPQAQLGTQADKDAAWRQLAQRAPEFDDPDVVAASKAADAVKPPPSKLDERVTAAEKADAFAKQMYDMFAHRLPEEDRVRLDDLIKRIEDDNEARETAIVRGGSCLFGVI